jgi:hypothetical protein
MGVTYPDPNGLAPAKSGLVGNFTSRADVIECMAASIYIPVLAGPWVTTRRVAGAGWVWFGLGGVAGPVVGAEKTCNSKQL